MGVRFGRHSGSGPSPRTGPEALAGVHRRCPWPTRPARRAPDRSNGPPVRGPAFPGLSVLDGAGGAHPLVPAAGRGLARGGNPQHPGLPRPAGLVGRDGARERPTLRVPLAVAAGRDVGDHGLGAPGAGRLWDAPDPHRRPSTCASRASSTPTPRRSRAGARRLPGFAASSTSHLTSGLASTDCRPRGRWIGGGRAADLGRRPD
jgi:hypothetical protein